MKIPATLKRYAHLIEEIEDYRSQGKDGDGYWVHLKPGWICTMTGVHSVHEDNITQCAELFPRFVKPCDCKDCQEMIERRKKEGESKGSV